jgi:deazaflavin-dependent oxidoreductase (nitroreductase family)
VEIVKQAKPPVGLRRALFRLPAYVYRVGLGWLFGRRIILLKHVGRVSGMRRQTILEVAEHDVADGSFVVASGWGPSADWYRNVVHTPDVSIQVGGRTIPVSAVPLTEDEGAEIFARYASRHRRTAKIILPRVLGLSVDGSDADFRGVGRRMPFVRFVPRA